MRRIAGVRIKRDNRYLLILEGEGPAKGSWNFPAGKIDTGETAEQAAAREAKEEAGVTVKIIRHIATLKSNSRVEDAELNAFEAEIVSGEPTAGEGIADIRWFTIEELEGMKDKLRGDWILSVINKK